jgi:hypothetical protein
VHPRRFKNQRVAPLIVSLDVEGQKGTALETTFPIEPRKSGEKAD